MQNENELERGKVVDANAEIRGLKSNLNPFVYDQNLRFGGPQLSHVGVLKIQKGMSVKCLHTNWGGENLSNEFDDNLARLG